MHETCLDSLLRDLLQWISSRQRTYPEALDAWRTSCPKLPIWEEANDRKFLECKILNGRYVVLLTAAGFAFLERGHHQRRVAPE